MGHAIVLVLSFSFFVKREDIRHLCNINVPLQSVRHENSRVFLHELAIVVEALANAHGRATDKYLPRAR